MAEGPADYEAMMKLTGRQKNLALIGLIVVAAALITSAGETATPTNDLPTSVASQTTGASGGASAVSQTTEVSEEISAVSQTAEVSEVSRTASRTASPSFSTTELFSVQYAAEGAGGEGGNQTEQLQQHGAPASTNEVYNILSGVWEYANSVVLVLG